MGNESVNAVIANAVFENLMEKLGARYTPAPIAAYGLLHLHEMASEHLEHLKPVLAGIAENYGFRYEHPMLTVEGERLITTSWTKFIKRYAWDLKDSMRSAMPGLVLI